MELLKARAIADDIISQLQPFCSRIEIAGSIRRRKSTVNDIDLVCIPSELGRFLGVLQQLGRIKMGGGKIIRVGMGFTRGIDLDLYIATPENWATLLLIRTGSAEHNVRLCSRAKRNGMKLHADGSGLFKIEAQGCEGVEVRIAGDTEESIFAALGIPYEAPEKRD
jgi:DNA polymerase (family 10)